MHACFGFSGVSSFGAARLLRLRRPIRASLMVAVCLWLLQSTKAAGQTFTIVDLGTLGGPNSSASAVSNSQVVGWSDTASGDSHAFSWTQAGGMVDLGALGYETSVALAVSNGQVVGSAHTDDDYDPWFADESRAVL